MAWKTITTGSIYTAISKAELDRYMTVSTSSLYNSSSLLQEIINDTIDEVRGYCAGNLRNQLDTDTSLIPSVTVSKAKQIVVYRLMERCAGKIADINEARKNDYDKAMDFLKDISNGKVGIDPTDNIVTPSQQAHIFGGDSDTPIEY